jgi:hypothetical protein
MGRGLLPIARVLTDETRPAQNRSLRHDNSVTQTHTFKLALGSSFLKSETGMMGAAERWTASSQAGSAAPSSPTFVIPLSRSF